MFQLETSILISININKEIEASAKGGRLKTNCDVSVSNAPRNNAGKSTSSVDVQVQSTDPGNVADLVGVNDILVDNLAGNASAIVSLSAQENDFRNFQDTFNFQNLLINKHGTCVD